MKKLFFGGNLFMQQIKRISKVYWNSGRKDALSCVIPKALRENMGIDGGDYVEWNLHYDEKQKKYYATLEKL